MLAFSLVISTGVALAYASMPALITAVVPLSETAAANGLNSLPRSLGTSISSAVIGVVLGQMTIRLGPVTVPSLGGIRVCLAICAGGAVLAVLIGLAIPGRNGPGQTIAPTAPEAMPALEGSVPDAVQS